MPQGEAGTLAKSQGIPKIKSRHQKVGFQIYVWTSKHQTRKFPLAVKEFVSAQSFSNLATYLQICKQE